MTVKQEWEKDSASPQPIFVIGDRSVSEADITAALEQFERRDTGLTKREYLIAAIGGAIFAGELLDGVMRTDGVERCAQYTISCADAIIDELQHRDDQANKKPPVVRENAT